MSSPSAHRPLENLRVIEMGQLIAGPFCGHLFADFGADVIKIEAPGAGDPMRTWGGVYKGLGLYWPIIARGKRSVTVNLRTPEGEELARKLISTADVLIENFRPGTLERWGLGWERLHELNPRLVLVRASGYGQTGPYRDKTGFGAIGEAMSGFRYLSGEPGRPPVRVGVSIGDSLAATEGFAGALMALYYRDRPGGSGRGQVVDIALYEAVWAHMEAILPEYEKLGRIRQPSGPILPGTAPSNVYPTRDGDWIVMGANQDSIFQRLCDLMGRPEWYAADAPYRTHVGRGQHQHELDARIAEWTATLDSNELLARLDGAGIPAGRIYTAADIAHDPHYAAREMLIELPEPALGGETIRMQGFVPKLSETPGGVARGGPLLGEHNDEVWGQWLDRATLEDYRARGII